MSLYPNALGVLPPNCNCTFLDGASLPLRRETGEAPSPSPIRRDGSEGHGARGAGWEAGERWIGHGGIGWARGSVEGWAGQG